MNDLEKLIADSIEARDAEDRAKTAEWEARQTAHKARIDAAIAKHLKLLTGVIPAPLVEFIKHAGREPDPERLAEKPEAWWPTDFVIDAPGLAIITFETGLYADKTARIERIYTNGHCFHDWPRAIATAADAFKRQTEWEAECEARRAAQAADQEPKPRKAAERLESLIREIARDEAWNLEI